MNGKSYRLRAEALTGADVEGFFLHNGALSEHQGAWEWQCPWCAHTLLFTGRDRLVAENSARGHVASQHGFMLWNSRLGPTRMFAEAGDRP